MTGTISKKHKFCTLVKVEDLKSLNNFIHSKYKYVEYTISLENGVNYASLTFDNIITYDNIEFKKIIQISIKAQNEEPITRSIINADFEIYLADLNNSSTSISYYIKTATVEEMEWLTLKIEELINNFKANYSWLHKNSTGVIIFIFIWICISTSLQIYLKDKVETVILSVFMYTLSALVGLVSNKIISFFFPLTVFCIGKQIGFYERKKKLRQNCLWGIIFTFIVGLIASILAVIITR
jgi:hypothetical protein